MNTVETPESGHHREAEKCPQLELAAYWRECVNTAFVWARVQTEFCQKIELSAYESVRSESIKCVIDETK